MRHFPVYTSKKILEYTNKTYLFTFILNKTFIILASMKKKRTNPWTIIGIAIAIILLIYWLITATILEEDENVIPILDGTEQVIP